MKKILFSIISVIYAGINIAAEEIVGGPWNTIFGETTAQVEAKIKQANAQLEIQTISGKQIDITSNVVVAGETFDCGAFLFANDQVYNHFGMCMFQKNISYDSYFSKHLNYVESEQWLVSNKHKVAQIIRPLKLLITSKYGNPIKDSDENIRWLSTNGNTIEIEVQHFPNLFEMDESLTKEFGCVPTFIISLIYIEGSDIPDF